MEEISCVSVYTGLGKGKTTAALGLAYRVMGHGGKAAVIFFTGPEYPEMGDVRAAAALDQKLITIGIESQARHLTYLADFAEYTSTVHGALALARDLLTQQECDLLILDDINPLMHDGTIDDALVQALLYEKPPNAGIVLTGRFAPQSIIEMADIVTDFAQIKHPSQAGVGPRRGFEF